MRELADFNGKLEGEITFTVESGNVLHDEGKLKSALKKYIDAWVLIPEPKVDWEISNWVAACLFSAYFDLENYGVAKEWAELALKHRASEIDTAPLINLGMVCYELRQHNESLKYFDKAYKYGKRRAFQGRPKKYLNYYLENSE